MAFEKRMLGRIGIAVRFDYRVEDANYVHLIRWDHRAWIEKCICMETMGGPLIYRPSLQRFVNEGYDFSMSFPCAFHLMFKDLRTLLKLRRKRFVRRGLAVAMGAHARLGAGSLLAVLDPDLIERICGLCP